ncbi:MAG: hypothetical protein AAGC55_27800, partial [Myxococcota bacterium]
MAQALIFSSEDALLAALTSDLVPAEVQRQPVRYRRNDDGALWVVPDGRLPAPVKERLRAAGVSGKRVNRNALRPARLWPEIIRPRLVPGETFDERAVIFVLGGPGSASGSGDSSSGSGDGQARPPVTRSLLDLAAELIRLGCDRCAYQLLADDGRDLAVLRADSPPYYTVAAAGDRQAPYRSYAPVSGLLRTWIELGYSHPLAGAFEPPDGLLGLISGDGQWITIPDGPWRDIFEFVAIAPPEPPRPLAARPLDRKLTVTLTLTKATRSEPPSLWVIRDAGDGRSRGPIAHIDTLVQTLPDDIIARLLFAVLRPTGQPDAPDSGRPGGEPAGGEPIVVLRARHGRSGPPVLDVAGTAMVALLGIPNLYVPHDAIVEPPLRRDTLRQLLAPDSDHLYWLAPLMTFPIRTSSSPSPPSHPDH